MESPLNRYLPSSKKTMFPNVWPGHVNCLKVDLSDTEMSCRLEAAHIAGWPEARPTDGCIVRMQVIGDVEFLGQVWAAADVVCVAVGVKYPRHLEIALPDELVYTSVWRRGSMITASPSDGSDVAQAAASRAADLPNGQPLIFNDRLDGIIVSPFGHAADKGKGVVAETPQPFGDERGRLLFRTHNDDRLVFRQLVLPMCCSVGGGCVG